MEENLLPAVPNWEVIITISRNRRVPEMMSVHVGLFTSLWSNAGVGGEDQDPPTVYFAMEVRKQEWSHKQVSERIADWLWEALHSQKISMVRFSTGKYLDSTLTPRYDNWLDMDVSMVLEQGSKDVLVNLVDKMVGYNRIYNKYLKEITNERRHHLEDRTTSHALRQIQGDTSGGSGLGG